MRYIYDYKYTSRQCRKITRIMRVDVKRARAYFAAGLTVIVNYSNVDPLNDPVIFAGAAGSLEKNCAAFFGNSRKRYYIPVDIFGNYMEPD